MSAAICWNQLDLFGDPETMVSLFKELESKNDAWQDVLAAQLAAAGEKILPDAWLECWDTVFELTVVSKTVNKISMVFSSPWRPDLEFFTAVAETLPFSAVDFDAFETEEAGGSWGDGEWFWFNRELVFERFTDEFYNIEDGPLYHWPADDTWTFDGEQVSAEQAYELLSKANADDDEDDDVASLFLFFTLKRERTNNETII